MKIMISVAALLAAFAACEQPQSRLDKVTESRPAHTPATSPPAANTPATPPSATGPKIDRTGSVEQQLARLQDAHDRNAEVMELLNREFAQQKAQQAQQQSERERNEPAADARFAVDVDGDIKAGQVDGPATAPITIIKAFDFACPYCQRVSGTMEELVKEYGGKVRVVYANLLVHAPARPAHLASCAAAKQGKYMQFKDAFWEKGFGPYAASQGQDAASLGEGNILTIAKGLGLDTDKLKADMNSPECAQRMDHDMKELQKFHVSATPTFFVNGKFVDGARPKDEFKKLIDEELKNVESSGVPAAQYYDKVVLAKGEKQFRSKMDPKAH
ncbi:MAG TPA: thioredoxin domain-containing protein [Kofleriaceae bacterium]|jgi:protein-disulfide isomerase